MAFPQNLWVKTRGFGVLYLVERFCKAWEDKKMSIVSIGSPRHRAPRHWAIV